MQVLWKKEIEEIKNSGYLDSKISVTDALIENFYNEILKPEEAMLMRLVFSENPKQEELDKLLKLWDIEVKVSHKSLLLAYFMQLHPSLKFSDYEKPRLNGLMKFFRFNNLNTIAHYSKIAKALNREGITPMILKGGAMKYMRPQFPRTMGDVDILVHDDEFNKAMDIILSLGYTYKEIFDHSVDFHYQDSENSILDLHRYIYMDTGAEKKLLRGIFKRARKEKVFSSDALVPSNEDMLFIALINLSRNLRDKTSQAGLLFSLFDCKYLIETKENFDWDVVKNNANITKTEVQMNFAIKFINKISEDVLPQNIKQNLLFEKETNDYSNVVLYNRFYLEDLRKKCRPIKIGNVFNSKEVFFEYLKFKPKYAMLKTIKNHPRLIEFFIKDLKTKEYNFKGECKDC